MEMITCLANNEATIENAPANSGPNLMESFSKMRASSFFPWDPQIMGKEGISFILFKYFENILKSHLF